MRDYNTEFYVDVNSSQAVDVQALSVTGTQNPADWFVELLGGNISDSGQKVDGYTALTSGPVWQACTILGNAIMSLPIDVIQTTSTKPLRTQKRPDMVASKLLREEPHPEFLPSAFKQLLTCHAALHGNGLARIDRDAGGMPTRLTPWLPNSAELKRDDMGGLHYLHYPEGGGEPEQYLQRDVFHIIGPHGGLWGTSLVEIAKNSIGYSLALQNHGSAMFKNAARPSGVLTKEGKMASQSRRNLREEWSEMHSGSDNTGKIAILQDGIKWHPLSMSNEDAQWLESRNFSLVEIASLFNMPPHMLGALENSSVRANLEEQNKSFYFQTLRPWLIRWQDEAYRKLFSEQQKRRGVFSVRFNSNALISADFETRMKGHATGRQWGWLSANDVLRLEDMDDIGDQGDKYMVPSNMADAETGEIFGKSGDSGGESDEMPGMPSSNEDETPQTLNFMRPGLIAELSKVLRIESKQIQRAAKRVSSGDREFNFCAFLDGFYDDEFVTIMCDKLHPLQSVAANLTADVMEIDETATTYAAESKEFWLTVAETSTPETLFLDVTERLGKWTDRASMAADMLLENNNGKQSI